MLQSAMPAKTVLICQSKACCKGGSAKVLSAFRSHLNSADSQVNCSGAGCNARTDSQSIAVEASGCLEQCGNGPMVLVLPDQVWYDRVAPQEVLAIVERHLQGGKPVEAMLYRKFHAS